MLDRIDFQRIFTASIGAAVLSSACVVGAVNQAKAADLAPYTVSGWQSAVNQQIDHTLRQPKGGFGRTDHVVSRIAVHFDAQGSFDGAAVAQASGNAAADREALRTARAIRYPALPAGLRGSPQTIAMQLYFGDGSNPALQSVEADRLADAALRNGAVVDTRTASR